MQSLFHEVLVVPHHRDEHIVPLDQGRHTEDDILLRGIHQDVQVELLLSICGQPLHVDEKYYQTMMIYIVMHPAVNQLHFTQHRGNTNAIIKIHHPTTSTTSMTTHPMTNHPQTRESSMKNPKAIDHMGRTILSPNLEPIHRVGLTIPKPPPNITATMTLPTSLPANLSLHFPLTVHVNLHPDPAQSNLVSPPVLSLPDMFPSIFKMVRERNGLVISSTL